MRTINRLCAIYVLCWTFFPFMQVGSIYRILAVGFALLWGVTAISYDRGFISENQNFFFIAFLTSIGMIACRMFLGLSVGAAVAGTLQFVIMMVAGMMALYFFRNDYDFLVKFFPLFLLTLVVFSFTTMRGLIENPYASRIANSEWLAERFKGNEMVGLYGYVYMCVFIQPMLLQLLLKKKRFGMMTDILIKVVFIENLVMIMISGYMIAIFCTIGSCLLLWMLDHRTPGWVLFSIIAIGLFILNYNNIVNGVFSYLINRFANNPVYAQKFIDFQKLFIGGDFSGETVEGRFSNYYHSLQTVIEYPIFGSYFSGNSGGGGHSALLDVFGKFGLFIGIMYCNLLFKTPHKLGYRFSYWQPLDYVILIITILFGFADPFFQEMGVALFIVFPLVMSELDAIEMGKWSRTVKK